MDETKRVLIYGGHGNVGQYMVKFFQDNGYWVASLDLVENPLADASIVVDIRKDWIAETQSVHDKVRNVIGGKRFDAIINVSGGHATGGVSMSRDFSFNCELMWREIVWTATISACLAVEYLKDDGSLIFCGDANVLEPTPVNIGYGMAKAAIHQLTKSLGDPSSGLPPKAFVACILPLALNTPASHTIMKHLDQGKFTPLDYVGKLFLQWIKNEKRPESGSLIKITTDNLVTKMSGC